MLVGERGGGVVLVVLARNGGFASIDAVAVGGLGVAVAELKAGDAFAASEGVGAYVFRYIAAGVEVCADGAVEQDGLLRDDGESLAETFTGDIDNVHAVVENLTLHDGGEAQEGQDERAFPGACAAHYGDTFTGGEGKVDVLEDVGPVRVVADGDVAEFNGSCLRPVYGDGGCHWIVRCEALGLVFIGRGLFLWL